jgi:hypothetical protein
VRTVIGTTPTALARRGMALDRLAVLTLRRDAYAASPGATLPLWLGERTQYRAATSIRDVFDRPDGALGAGYTPWIAADAGGLVIQGRQVVPGVVNAEPHLAGYGPVLPREQWGEITIRALTGTGAVGVGLRWVTQSGYLVGARPGTTALRRLNAGASTTLLDLVTPWQLGDVLQLRADWDRLWIFRNGTRIGECVDPAPLLVAGQVALYASQLSASDAAALDNFAAGPLRQEYRGLLADVGDVSASLGFVEPTASPAAWSMSVINLAPVGPPGRFSIAWRHGQNDGPDTYELHRAPVTLALAVAGGSVPLALADGRVDHPEALTEGLVRLDCAGRDAFLTPDIQAGPVAYVPGPDPINTPAPIPLDPCGADAEPVIVPGPPPTEPPGTGEGEARPVADGPEAADPGDPPADRPPLQGLWQIEMWIRPGNPELNPPEPTWVAETRVTELVDQPYPATYSRNLFNLNALYNPNMNMTDIGWVWRYLIALYRGPDIVASVLTHGTYEPYPTSIVIDDFVALGNFYTTAVIADAASISWSVTGKLADYQADQIYTVADLQALRLKTPEESADYLSGLPPRYQTLTTFTATQEPVPTCDSHGCTGRQYHYSDGVESDAVALNRFTGPQLLVMELLSTTGPIQGPPAGRNYVQIGFSGTSHATDGPPHLEFIVESTPKGVSDRGLRLAMQATPA